MLECICERILASVAVDPWEILRSSDAFAYCTPAGCFDVPMSAPPPAALSLDAVAGVAALIAVLALTRPRAIK